MSLGGTDSFRLRALRALAALAAVTAGALALLAMGGGVERAVAGTGCPNADATINEASGKKLRRAIICRINEKRKDHDRRVLDSNGKLQSAAAKHNKAMEQKNCWEHRCPGEPSLGKRIRNSGYLDGAERWRYAQNFGCAVTPAAMVRAWMKRKFSRENIRNSAFRDIGVAVLKDQIPKSRCRDGDEVTYTVNFGRRKG